MATRIENASNRTTDLLKKAEARKEVADVDYAGRVCYLVDDKTKKRVHLGDVVCTSDGHKYTVTGGRAPHKESSSGRIYVKQSEHRFGSEYFPSVVNTHWMVAK